MIINYPSYDSLDILQFHAIRSARNAQSSHARTQCELSPFWERIAATLRTFHIRVIRYLIRHPAILKLLYMVLQNCFRIGTKFVFGGG